VRYGTKGAKYPSSTLEELCCQLVFLSSYRLSSSNSQPLSEDLLSFFFLCVVFVYLKRTPFLSPKRPACSLSRVLVQVPIEFLTLYRPFTHP
jgi:hypothetical protein